MSQVRETPAPAEVCILRLSAIGDTCHVLAVLRNLQSAWPQTRFTWVIGQLEAQLFADVAGVEFITFDKRAGSRSQQLQPLRDRRFDILLHMHASMRANLVSRHIKAQRRIGFDRARARDFQWLFTRERIPHRPHQHVLDGLLGFVDFLGLQRTAPRWDIPIRDEDAAFARQQRNADRGLVVLSPCSSQRARNFRNWPVARYAEIVDYLADSYETDVVLTGGPTSLERDYALEIGARSQAAVTDLVGKTSLRQLYALISEADAVICPDSGPAHMATAAATPVIGLYASSNPGRTGPYRSRELTVNRYPDALR
ncbi:MAG: glycosyltransferase family 9 protein, partial [Gammaproteobacteria bacterium]|nr:glycosyltransferase family 9 protein [Gammaproteobacteria bacterium]